MVIIQTNPEKIIEGAVASPQTIIASDGLLENGKGHPRTSGTYARVLGRYVRERKTLSLMDALRKMPFMPARRLEHRVPAMQNKSRIHLGADADLTIFDSEHILDTATYEKPAKYSEGIQYVLVNGVLVVNNGAASGRRHNPENPYVLRFKAHRSQGATLRWTIPRCRHVWVVPDPSNVKLFIPGAQQSAQHDELSQVISVVVCEH